jgi:hypothetical protein
MGNQCHSMGSLECTLTETATNSGRPVPHSLHRPLGFDILFSLCDTPFLAITYSIHDLHHVLECVDFRNTKSSFRFSTIITSLVTLRFLLPSKITSNSGASSNEKVYFWISSSWHHFYGCFCSVLHRSFRIFATVPWNQEHTPYSGFKFQNSYLP